MSCFKVSHRIPCWGFRFEEVKPLRKVIPEKAIEHGVPSSFFDHLKWGEDYITKSGLLIKNDLVTAASSAAKSYAYSADTIYDERIIDKVQNVDLLYHETTYLKDLEDRAAKRFHCTTAQAATIALKATVGKLLIGHFSSKYDELSQFINEAREVFANADLAIEGVTYRI